MKNTDNVQPNDKMTWETPVLVDLDMDNADVESGFAAGSDALMAGFATSMS